MTSNATSTPTLGHIAYDAYGSHPGPVGSWATFDGRTMPFWEELNTDNGRLTQERWEIAVAAAIAEHERRKAPTPTLDVAEVISRLEGSHEYQAHFNPVRRALRVAVPHGEDPGRWLEIGEETLRRLHQGGTGAVTMALQLMLAGPRGGRADAVGAPEEPGDSGGPVASLSLTAWTPESGEALTHFFTQQTTAARTGAAPSLFEVCSATRDLAEAARAIADINGTRSVAELVEDVAKALHARVGALASPHVES